MLAWVFTTFRLALAAMLLLACCLSAAVFVSSAKAAERRVALVIAADDYRKVRPLANAVNDGAAIAEVLEALKFEVIFESNRDLRRMRRALEDFQLDAAGADVALVYFAGHGTEVQGENRLLPIDADATTLAILQATSLPLEEVRAVVGQVGKVGLIILDACRNDPFGSGSADGRSVGAAEDAIMMSAKPGLGRMGKAANILFAFSAAPGETAADGTDGHSPFAAALAKYLSTDGLEIRSVLTLVQQEVYDKSRGAQLPYVESGLPQMFFAATTRDSLPERERLLLAMADVTPDLRREVEKIATENQVPLATLYGALVSNDLGNTSLEDRLAKLQSAAAAFVKLRQDMARLSEADPEVKRLRLEAEDQLALGAFDAARAKYAEAIALDGQSRATLKTNLVERTISEAATHYLSGTAAEAGLKHALAIADMEAAAGLYDEISGFKLKAESRRQHLEILWDVGDIQIKIGNLAAARQAYERQKTLAENVSRSEPDNVNWQRDLSVSHIKIGDILMATGDRAAALKSYQDGFIIAERLAALDLENTERQRDIVVSHNKIGSVFQALGDSPAALKSYQDGLAIAQRLADRNPDNTEWQRDLTVTFNRIGDVQMAQGDGRAAFKSYGDGLAIAESLVRRAPDNTEWQRDVSVSYIKIGNGQTAQGDIPAALMAYQASLAITSRLAASDPENVFWQRDLSVIQNKIGLLQVAQGDSAAALKSYLADLAISKQLTMRDPENAEWQRDLSVSYDNVGDVYEDIGDIPAAMAAYQAGLAIARQLTTRDPGNSNWQLDLSVGYNKIGNLQLAQGDTSAALISYQAGLAKALEVVARDPENAQWQRDLSVSYSKMGSVLWLQGDAPAALKSYQTSMEIRQKLVSQDPGNAEWSRDLMVAHWNLAVVGERPRENFNKARDVLIKLKGENRLAPVDVPLIERLDGIIAELPE